MQRVRGIGGVFFKSENPDKLQAWYRDILGIQIDSFGGAFFRWSALDTSNGAGTVFAPFKADTEYFSPSQKPFMVNFVVDNLDAMLAQARQGGAVVEDKITEESYGKFGWLLDPEGNKIELWEPRTPKEAQ
ncbi:MAG: VOC family protein [Myxococcales bacterium]|jgi:predicted enzyme related to lactoylglutathione lyase|nr:VOC family protein [Myxococcales bacterium]